MESAAIRVKHHVSRGSPAKTLTLATSQHEDRSQDVAVREDLSAFVGKVQELELV